MNRQGQAASMGALERLDAPAKKAYPGHMKLMQDLKGARNKIEKYKKEYLGKPDHVKAREQLEALRLEHEPENTRLMRIKYEEKQAEKNFIEEQKAVEGKLVEFNLKNKEHLTKTRENYDRIKENDNNIIASHQAKIREAETECAKLNLEIDKRKAERDRAHSDLIEKEIEKKKLDKQLKHLSIYEVFLYKVLKASDDYDTDEKPKEAIKKLIDRYERLKQKQNDLVKDTLQKEEEKKKKLEALNKKKQEMQNEIFKMNSEMHKIQQNIDVLHNQLRDIDIVISDKVKMNQDKMIEHAKIETAVNNLFRMVRESKRKNIDASAETDKQGGDEDLSKKLDEIRDRMNDIKVYYTAYTKKQGQHQK